MTTRTVRRDAWALLDGRLIGVCGNKSAQLVVGLIEVSADARHRERNNNFAIGISDFESLALEMVKADPEKAIKAFCAATVKAFDTALNPPAKEDAA
jgi:hypothetical protein